MIPFICNVQNRKIYRESRLPRAVGEDWGVVVKKNGVSFWRNENTLVRVAQLCEYIKTLFVYFQWVNCMVCKLTCNKTVRKKIELKGEMHKYPLLVIDQADRKPTRIYLA